MPARAVGKAVAWGEAGGKTIRGMVFPTTAATLREISARWAFMASVLTKGSTRPTAALRAGQTAPASEPVNATGSTEQANAH